MIITKDENISLNLKNVNKYCNLLKSILKRIHINNKKNRLIVILYLVIVYNYYDINSVQVFM